MERGEKVRIESGELEGTRLRGLEADVVSGPERRRGPDGSVEERVHARLRSNDGRPGRLIDIPVRRVRGRSGKKYF